jgi:TPP-dependent indolepyruvate ferredoxin oxidoreductase alpha subunit
MNRIAVLCVAGGFLLAACGSTPGDRAMSGGAMGAGVGALAGLAVGMPVTGLDRSLADLSRQAGLALAGSFRFPFQAAAGAFIALAVSLSPPPAGSRLT